jgi:hypothetical protein
MEYSFAGGFGLPLRWPTLFFAALIVAPACRPQTNLRAKVQAKLEQELPIGSTPEQALRLFDSARVQHSQYLRDRGRVITANFGESYRLLLMSNSVYVTLHYDERDRLNRHDVEEIASGP